MPQSQAPPPRSAAAAAAVGERKRQLDEWRRQRQEQQQQQTERKPPPFRPVSVRPRAASSSSASAARAPQPPAGKRRATMATPQTPKLPPSAASDSSTESRSSPGGSRSPPSPASPPAPVDASATPQAEDVAVLQTFFDHEAQASASVAPSRDEHPALVVAKQRTLEDEIVAESFQESEPSAALSPTWRSLGDMRDDDAARTLERNLIGEFDAGAGDDDDALTDASLGTEAVAAVHSQEQCDDGQVDDEQVLAMLLDRVVASRAARENDAPSELDDWLQDDRALQSEEEMARRGNSETKAVEAPIVYSPAVEATATTATEATEALTSSAVKRLASDSGDQTRDEERDFEDAAAHAPLPSRGANEPSDAHEDDRQLEEAEPQAPRRSAQPQSRRPTRAVLAGVSGLFVLALLLCSAACWFSSPGAQTLTHHAAATCVAVPIKRALVGVGAWWTDLWSGSGTRKFGLVELAASSLSQAKTVCATSSESLQRHGSNYVTSVLKGLSAAASSSAHAIGSVWESVFPSSRDADLVATTRAQLLDPFEADQRALNDKLKALMLKQEAWALAELKRMKQRRALQASATESILTSTRTLVLDALREAKAIAELHVESYTETISDQLLRAIQRELEEHEQRMGDELQQTARTAAKQEAEALEQTARQQLDALEQQKADEEQVLDLELSVDESYVAAAKESLVHELAAMAEREKAKIEAEYARVSADVASKLEQVEHDLVDANFADAESQVADVAVRAQRELDEEDAKLLEELKTLEALAATRVVVEQERALADVADAATQQAEQLRLERQAAEQRARALAEAEARVAAERKSAEEEIAEVGQRDILGLEKERRTAEEELLAAREQEQQRIQQQERNAGDELARIKQEQAELAQREPEKAADAIAAAARVEELRVQQEQEQLEARVAHDAAAEEKRLRAERAAAGDALERALQEERAELLARLAEGKQRVQATVVDVDALVLEPVAPAAVELLPSAAQGAAVGPEVASVASTFPSIPNVELRTLGLVSAAFLVLAGATAWVLGSHRRRLEVRRRQQARAALKARRKRWQRVAESESDAEEVVLLARPTGEEPEPEVLGSPFLSAASEDSSQASSVEELDERSTTRQVDALLPDDTAARDEAVAVVAADESHADADAEEESVSTLAARRPNASPHTVVRRRALRVTRTTRTTTTTLAGDTA